MTELKETNPDTTEEIYSLNYCNINWAEVLSFQARSSLHCVRDILLHNHWVQSLPTNPKPAKGFGGGEGQSRVCERQENPSYHVGKSIIQH